MVTENGDAGVDRVKILLQRGAKIPFPESVQIDASVNPEHISPDVVIHAGCRITGAKTSIGPGCKLGEEAPVTVDNCQLGHKVEFKGGYAAGSVFLEGSSAGSGAHVRPGCLLEEEASIAHTVGLKQTIFLSFVTAGSLINACDMLMAGGTSRRNHSEIGSSFVHFNFTPHGDKATPSLVGDVPRGVLLDQAPIFLGGQGGMVGPVRIEYGCCLPAGQIRRKDALEPNQMLFSTSPRAETSKPYNMGVYGQINRTVENNLIYIGNIRALQAWYTFARKLTMSGDEFQTACYEGALRVLESVLKERVKRLVQFSEKVALSVEILQRHKGGTARPSALAQQEAFLENWPELEHRLGAGLETDPGGRSRDAFLQEWAGLPADASHVEAVVRLPDSAKKNVKAWLKSIVDATVSGA